MGTNKYSFKQCDTCKEEFMGAAEDTTCDDCLGVVNVVVGVPTIGSYDRLGDTRFKQAPQEWNDLLKKIKKENPGSTIEVK